MVADMFASSAVARLRSGVRRGRWYKYLVTLVFVLGLVLPATALASGPGEGSIEGQVVNSTKGGASVAGHDIVLKTMLDRAEADSRVGRLDAEGRFSFNELQTEPGYSYQVVMTFQQADYFSEILAFAGDETAKTAQVTVYDSTASAEAIVVGIAHTVVYVEPDGLRVREFFYFVNEGDRTYIGSEESALPGKKETLQFFLPDEATDLEPQAGLDPRRISRREDGFVDTLPVPPEGREVVFAYRVGYQPGQSVFSWKSGYPTANYDFLVHGQGLNLTSDRLTARDPLYIGGAPFSRLSGSSLSAGDTVTVTFSGLPGVDNSSRPSRLPLIAALVAAGALAFWLVLRRSKAAQAQSQSREGRQKLLADIARLDEDFEAGAISERTYRDLRAEKKSQLVALINRQHREAD